MELVERVELLEHPFIRVRIASLIRVEIIRRYVFRKLSVIKPLNKIAKLRDNWSEWVGRVCINRGACNG